MTQLIVDYWDEVSKSQKTRPMTDDEIAQRDKDIADAAKPVVPLRVSMRQAKLALLDVGLYDAVNSHIEALPEPQRTAALIEWNSAYCERENALVKSLPAALGWPDGQVDQLFIAAAQIE